MEAVQTRIVGGRVPVIEKVEERRPAQRLLFSHQSLRRPPVQGVSRRSQYALLHVGAGIEPQKFVGQVSVAVVNDGFVCGRIRGRMRCENHQRADFPAIEAGEYWHWRLFAFVEDIHQLARQHMAVDRTPWRIPRRRCGVTQRGRVHRSHRFDIRCVQGGSQLHSALLRRR